MNTNTNTKESQSKQDIEDIEDIEDIPNYLNQLSIKERKILDTAKNILESSFNIRTSIGFLEWKKINN